MSEYDCAVLGLAHGTQQSPIDIQKRQAFKADLPEISFAYPSEIRGALRKTPGTKTIPSLQSPRRYRRISRLERRMQS
jgi:carbonic anhydrase